MFSNAELNSHLQNLKHKQQCGNAKQKYEVSELKKINQTVTGSISVLFCTEKVTKIYYIAQRSRFNTDFSWKIPSYNLDEISRVKTSIC